MGGIPGGPPWSRRCCWRTPPKSRRWGGQQAQSPFNILTLSKPLKDSWSRRGWAPWSRRCCWGAPPKSRRWGFFWVSSHMPLSKGPVRITFGTGHPGAGAAAGTRRPNQEGGFLVGQQSHASSKNYVRITYGTGHPGAGAIQVKKVGVVPLQHMPLIKLPGTTGSWSAMSL